MTSDFQFKIINKDFIPEIQSVMNANKDYYLRISGDVAPFDESEDLFTSFPADKTAENLTVSGLFRNEKLMGFSAWLASYPDPHTVFLALHMISPELHGKGSGNSLFLFAESLHSGFTKCRLAVHENNDVRRFWQKLGFTETGEIKPVKGGRISGNAFIMEKFL